MPSYKDHMSILSGTLLPLGQHSGEQYPAAAGEAPQDHAIRKGRWRPLSGKKEAAAADSHEGAAGGDKCASGNTEQAAQDY